MHPLSLTKSQDLLLDISHLSVHLIHSSSPKLFRSKLFGTKSPTQNPLLISDVSMTIHPGERVGFVGPSGSGKTITAFTLAGMYQELGMGITYEGFIRPEGPGEISMIFQEPRTALNPFIPIGKQFSDLWRLYRPGTPKKERTDQVEQLIRDLGISEPKRILQSYPGEISGGQCQRVALAQALASHPKLIIADEPTSSIDSSIRSLVLDLLYSITNQPGGPALLFISHDLSVVQELCTRIIPIEQGKTGQSLDVKTWKTHSDISQSKIAESQSSSKEQPAIDTHHPPILSIHRGSYRYPGCSEWALKDIDLKVYPGERVGILGESGGGKTTLFKLMSGMLASEPPGIVEIEGKNLARLTGPEHIYQAQSLQTIFQDPRTSLSPWLENLMNLREPLDLWNRAEESTIISLVQEKLRDVALEDPLLLNRMLTRKADQLSGGQRQRIAIARSLTVNPRVILADEPFSALDPEVRDSILELLVSLQKEQAFTLILISHNLEVVRRTCQRILVIDQGQIVEDRTTQEFFGTPGPSHRASKALLHNLLWSPEKGSQKDPLRVHV